MFHDLVGNNHMRRFAAYPREGVAGAIRAVGELQVGLNHITLTRLEFVLPLFTHGQNIAAKFVADDDGIGRHIVGYFFMVFTQIGLFPGREAQAVSDHRREDFILLHFRKVKGFQA